MLRILIRFKTAFTAIIFLIIALITMSSKINTERFYFRTFLFSVLFEFENVILSSVESVKNAFVNIKRIQELENRLDSAEERLLHYRELTFLYDQIKNENDRLRRMLNISSRLSYPAHYSKVIFRDPTLLGDYLIVDKGYQQGIRLHMPVVYASETNDLLVLVGKVVEVTDKVSKVRLISAKNLYLAVQIKDKGFMGILKGQGSWNQNLSLDYIPINADVQLGDIVVTSAESEAYPPDLYVGSIQGIGQNVIEEFYKILYVRPYFNYKKISDVFILEYKKEYNISNITVGSYER